MARIDDLEKGLVDQYGVAVRAELNDRGQEVGDPVPVAPPANLRRGMSTSDQIRQMIQRELSMRAQEQDFETFEEADDFDIDDDPADPHTPYEAVFDPQPPVVKENKDGVGQGDEGRSDVVDSGARKPDPVGKGKSGPKRSDADQGSVRTAGGDARGPEGQD